MFSRRRGKKALDACARTPRRAFRQGFGRAARSARDRRSPSGSAVRPGRAWRRGSRPARLAHRAPAAAGRTLPSGQLYDQRGHPEDEGDDDRSGHESRCDEADHRVGGALEAEHPAARAVAAVDVRAERRELHRRGIGRVGGGGRPRTARSAIGGRARASVVISGVQRQVRVTIGTIGRRVCRTARPTL